MAKQRLPGQLVSYKMTTSAIQAVVRGRNERLKILNQYNFFRNLRKCQSNNDLKNCEPLFSIYILQGKSYILYYNFTSLISYTILLFSPIFTKEGNLIDTSQHNQVPIFWLQVFKDLLIFQLTISRKIP